MKMYIISNVVSKNYYFNILKTLKLFICINDARRSLIKACVLRTGDPEFINSRLVQVSLFQVLVVVQ